MKHVIGLLLVLVTVAHADADDAVDTRSDVKAVRPVHYLDRPDGRIAFGRDGAGELGVALLAGPVRLYVGETFRKFDHDEAVATIDLTLRLGIPARNLAWWARPRFTVTTDFDTASGIGGETALRGGLLVLHEPQWMAAWFEIGKRTNGPFFFGFGARALVADSGDFRLTAALSLEDLEGTGSRAYVEFRPELRFDQWALFAEFRLSAGTGIVPERIFGLTSSWRTEWLAGIEFRV